VTKTSTVVPGRPPFITPRDPDREEYDFRGPKEQSEIDVLQSYIDAGAAKNMLPLCWGIDGIATHRPRLCRKTARRGKVYCKFHAFLEDK
jgi:hypothetical protein